MHQDQQALLPQERRAVIGLGLIYATRMLGLFMLLPIMALYLSGFAEVSPMIIGLAIGIYGLTQAALQIPFGMISDRIGRKPVIMAGLVLFLLGSLLAAVAENAWLVVAGRALQGAGAVAGVTMALLADLTRETQRSKAMAMMGFSIGAAFILALVLGPLLYSELGGQGVFALIAGLAAIAMILLWLAVPSPAASKAKPAVQNIGKLLQDQQLWVYNSGIFVLHAMLTAIFIAVPLMLKNTFDLALEWHSLLYMAIMAISFILMLPLLLYTDRRDQIALLFVAAAALLGLAQLILALAGDQWGVFLFALLAYFFAFNALEAALPAALSKRATAANRGAAMSVYSSCQFAGAFAGGLFGGIVMQHYGTSAVFWFGSILSAIWLIMAARAAHSRPASVQAKKSEYTAAGESTAPQTAGD